MSLSREASSGVRLTGQGDSERHVEIAPLRPVRSFKILVSCLRSDDDWSNASVAALKNRVCRRNDPCSSCPNGGRWPRTTARHGAASAGNTTL